MSVKLLRTPPGRSKAVEDRGMIDGVRHSFSCADLAQNRRRGNAKSRRAVKPTGISSVSSHTGRTGDLTMRNRELIAAAMLGSALTLGACASNLPRVKVRLPARQSARA